MRRIRLLSSAPCIAIADEPVVDGAGADTADGRASATAFELVPPWQARGYGRRGLWVAVPLVAVAAAIAAGVGRDRDAEALRDRPAAATTLPATSGRALVVSAGPTQSKRAAGSR